MNVLIRFQASLNAMAQHPLTLGIAVVFLTVWTVASMISHGKFDQGLGIENLIINGLSILLLFAANNKAAGNISNENSDKLTEIHEHVVAMKKHVVKGDP